MASSPAVQEAQRKGQIVKRDPFSQRAFDADIKLTIALQDRELQQPRTAVPAATATCFTGCG
jgi:hypothetical protein